MVSRLFMKRNLETVTATSKMYCLPIHLRSFFVWSWYHKSIFFGDSWMRVSHNSDTSELSVAKDKPAIRLNFGSVLHDSRCVSMSNVVKIIVIVESRGLECLNPAQGRLGKFQLHRHSCRHSAENRFPIRP